MFDFSRWTQALITDKESSLSSQIRSDFKLQSTPKGLLPQADCKLTVDDKLSFITPESYVKIDPTRIPKAGMLKLSFATF